MKRRTGIRPAVERSSRPHKMSLAERPPDPDG